MIIANAHDAYLSITAPEITAIANGASSYTKIEVTASINCGTAYTQNITNVPLVPETTILITADDGSIRINPIFFGGITQLVNGVYKISIKIFQSAPVTETILIANCTLVDMDLNCKVSALLHNIIGEYEDKLAEKPSSLAHLLHYSLVNGSNCGCNCDEMCKNYDALIDILTNIDPQLLADCNC